MMCAFSSCPPCLHIQATLCACVLQGTPLCAPQGTPAHACLSTKTTNYIPFSLLKNNIYYYIIIAKAKILKKKIVLHFSMINKSLLLSRKNNPTKISLSNNYYYINFRITQFWKFQSYNKVSIILSEFKF